MIPDCWYTTTQASEYLGVHRNTILNWVREGRCKAHKINKRVIKFEASELQRI